MDVQREFSRPLGLTELKRLRAALDEPHAHGRPFVACRVEDEVMRSYLDAEIDRIQRGSDGQNPTENAP